MKNLATLLFFCLLSFGLFAQNVGIGTATPLEKLHVAGAIRANSLVSTDTNVVLSDLNGTLINLGPGNSGDLLVSRGAGRAPEWSGSTPGAVQTFGVFASRTFINSTAFIQVNGLSRSITLTNNAVVVVTTYGSLETTSSFWGGSGCIVQLFNNGTAVPSAFQTVDVNDAPYVTNTIQPWSFTAYLNLTPGTYTFSVRARKYAFDNFYAGGNFTAPNPNEGALTILVINQ